MPDMKRFSKLLKAGGRIQEPNLNTLSDGGEPPEASAARGVRLFCESASPTNAGEEVLHLPVIVEAAESSPTAAASAAHQIRKFLNRDHYARPHVQYNAVMLIRILADNPGPSFTKNIDDKFVETVKLLLRQSRDPSVQQIIRETLNAFEEEKAYDENLGTLVTMWNKERGQRLAPQQQIAHRSLPGHLNAYGGFNGGPQTTFNTYSAARWATQPAQSRPPNPPRTHSNLSQLPPPVELASRIEEALTSASLLMQLSSSTPATEVPSNDLLQEFSDRCQSAQRSMEGYMTCTNPAPDEDTFQTLIETCEQLSLANSRYQRAVLAGRREIGTIGGSGDLHAYSPQLKAPLLGKSPSGPSMPVPALGVQQQLEMRYDQGGPSSSQLYPSSSSAVTKTVNPFKDDRDIPTEPVPIELEAPYGVKTKVGTSQQPNNGGYNAALARRPPIPTVMPVELPQPQSQTPTQVPNQNTAPQSVPWQTQRPYGTDEGGLYDESPYATSTTAPISPIYGTHASIAPTADLWPAQKQPWTNVTTSVTATRPSSGPTYIDEAYNAESATEIEPIRSSGPASSILHPPQQQHLKLPPPVGAFQNTSSYIHHQGISMNGLSMSGAAGEGVGSVPPAEKVEEEGRAAIDQERKRRSWRDFPTTRPAIPSSWGEESYVRGSGEIRDV